MQGLHFIGLQGGPGCSCVIGLDSKVLISNHYTLWYNFIIVVRGLSWSSTDFQREFPSSKALWYLNLPLVQHFSRPGPSAIN